MAGNGKALSRHTASDGRPSLAGNGARHSRVAEVQRARLLAAMVGEVAERGAANVSVAHVVARAGVSRRTFYELFDDRDDCFLAAFDDALACVTRHAQGADDPSAGWIERIRATLAAILSFLDSQRDAGQLLIVGSLGAGAGVLERRRRVLAQLVAVVDQGRLQTKAGAELPPLTAEGIVGGVLSIVQARIETEPQASLADMTGALMGMIVLPYLGAAAARREQRRPSPERALAPPPRREDPLRGLEMRLTYRTIRVLAAVAQEPGSSNRRVGEVAEIGDQGQVSKLLARLQRLDLIENSGEGAATRGEPNAWRLTPRGALVQETTAGLAPDDAYSINRKRAPSAR